MYSKIKGFFLFLVLFVCVVFFVFLMSVCKDKQREIRRKIAKTIKFFLRYEIEIEGEIDEGVQMFVLNHQSALDILIFDEILPCDNKWIAKKELGDIFILGAGFRTACILIDRKNPREIVHILKAAKECVDKKEAIMIFPEGTRSRGDKLLKFQPGAQIIANKLGLKVQPALIVGSRKLVDTKSAKVKSGKVKVVFLPSFEASEGKEWLDDTKNKMQEILDFNLNKTG